MEDIVLRPAKVKPKETVVNNDMAVAPKEFEKFLQRLTFPRLDSDVHDIWTDLETYKSWLENLWDYKKVRRTMTLS